MTGLGASRLTVAAGMVFGAVAVIAVNWVDSSAIRLLVALAVLGAGLAARRAGHRAVELFGILLGSYLTGVVLAAIVAPHNRMLAILLGLGLLAAGLALVRVAAGVGVVLPVLLLGVLVESDATTRTLAITLAALAVLSVGLAAVSRSRWRTFATALGATAATLTIGPATWNEPSVDWFRFSFGWFEVGPVGPSESRGLLFVGVTPPSSGIQVELVAVALAVGVVLLVMAAARKDWPGALVTGAVFAVSPVITGAETAAGLLVGVPIIAGALALVALLPRVRWLMARATRIPPAALVSAAAIAAVAVAVQAVPALEWTYRTKGVVASLVLAAAGALAFVLRGLPGAVLAGVVLVGWQLASPWSRLINDDPASPANQLLIGMLGLLVAGAMAAILVPRHRRAGVVAAATYLLAGTLALLFRALLSGERTSGPIRYSELTFDVSGLGELATMIVLVGPVLLLGVPAAVLALRGSATGQAAGAVLLSVGGLGLLRVFLGPNGGGLDQLLDPLTPTAVLLDTEPPGSAVLLGTEALFALGVVLLLSVVQRPSTPLAAAAVLVTFCCARIAVLAAPRASEMSGVDGMLWALVVLGMLLAGGAVGEAGRRDRSLPGEAGRGGDLPLG